MECSKTKRLANKDWPLFRITEKGRCSYKVVANSEDEAAAVIEDAQTKLDYDGRSESTPLPNNKVKVYLYFKKS